MHCVSRVGAARRECVFDTIVLRMNHLGHLIGQIMVR